MQFAVGEGGAAGHVGAVLVLDSGPEFSLPGARRLLDERIRAVPRLRQRLYRGPPGRGRPYWADDPDFDLGAHVGQVRCPAPGDERALLDVAAARLCEPLPPSRPMWSATFVTGVAGEQTGLVFVLDHVLADGVAGLSLLGRLADQLPGTAAGAGTTARAGAAAAPAGPGTAGRERSPRRLRRLRAAVTELGLARLPHGVPATSLNRPVGPRRRIDVVAADLAAVRELGHAHGGTVNDVLLAAVAGALRSLLAARGEQLDQVTIVVPVAARLAVGAGQLGNHIGIMPVIVPADGDLGARVTRAAAITRERKLRVRGASAALFVPAFLLLARTGLLRWFDNRQRLIQTFVTNLPGPRDRLTFGGTPIRSMIAIPATAGNVTVTFGAVSYAGALRITILSDPARVPDAPALAAALRRELAACAARCEGTLVLSMQSGSAVPRPGRLR
jgi:diacylglycerol O-acyltransferase / wax synthase